MNYREAMEYIERSAGFGIVPGLDGIRKLCRLVGDPQDSLRFIHIAGTNGKGSTVAFLEQILTEAGYTVGRYTSPAVFEYRERFQVKGRRISQAAFCKHLETVSQAADRMAEQGDAHPTQFEMETVLSFLFFAEKKCDLVLLECGMGGAQDATNVITTSVVSVFASVSMDHMGYLGKTLNQIAIQKSGIMKNGTPAVTTWQNPEVLQVFRSQAIRMKTRLYEASEGKVKDVKVSGGKQTFTYGSLKRLSISMPGIWQIQNAVLAVEVCGILRKNGYPITEEQMRNGLKDTIWPGRLQKIGNKPDFYIDGAHNPDAAEKLAKTLQEMFPETIENGKLIGIMGVLRDKDHEAILKYMRPCIGHLITVTPPGNPRALGGYDLAKEANELWSGNAPVPITSADSLQEAVEMAYLLSSPDCVILAFGSLSYLGSVCEIVETRKTMRRDSHGR